MTLSLENLLFNVAPKFGCLQRGYLGMASVFSGIVLQFSGSRKCIPSTCTALTLSVLIVLMALVYLRVLFENFLFFYFLFFSSSKFLQVPLYFFANWWYVLLHFPCRNKNVTGLQSTSCIEAYWNNLHNHTSLMILLKGAKDIHLLANHLFNFLEPFHTASINHSQIHSNFNYPPQKLMSAIKWSINYKLWYVYIALNMFKNFMRWFVWICTL